MNRLSTESPEAAEHFLRSAFAYARPEEQSLLARLLLKTGRVGAIRAVLTRLDSLELDDADLRAVAMQPLHAALRTAFFSAEHDLCTNALFCIRRRRIPADAMLFVEMPPKKERDLPAYGMTVLALVSSALGQNMCLRPSADDRATLERAAITLLNVHNGHRLPSVRLAAAMLAHEPGPVLAEEFRRRESIVASALRGVVDLVDDEQVQRLLMKWLASSELGRTVARRLSDLVTTERFDAIFDKAVLLRTPARRAMLRQIERPLRVVSSASVETHPKRASAIVDVVLSADLTHQTRVDRMRKLIEVADDRTSIRARLALAAMDAEKVEAGDRPALQRVQVSLDWRMGKSAATSLVSGYESPLSRVALLHDASTDARLFWSIWKSLSETAQRVAAMSAIRADRDAFIERMRSALIESAADESMRILALVRRLGLACDVELELLALAGSPDERLASAAVSIVANSDAPSRTGVLRAAVQRGKGRVRANAVQSASFRRVTLGEVDVDHDPRLRVNFILAADVEPDDWLARVLRDERSAHRRSAIWAAGRRGGSQCLVELKRLSSCEPDDRLRERVERAARLLALRLDDQSQFVNHPARGATAC